MKGLGKRSWVLVLDGAKALILRDEGDHLAVVSKATQDNPPDREQKSDLAGRGRSPAGVRGSAIEETDYHDLEETRFAEDMAGRLYKAAHAGEFERLVLVAGPNIVGPLRAALHKEVADKVVAEIPKTLTNHPLPEIERLVCEALAA